VEGKILAAEWARKMKKPFLGKHSGMLWHSKVLSIVFCFYQKFDN
jgi:CTP synthase (UTP-ammonia lyase)